MHWRFKLSKVLLPRPPKKKLVQILSCASFGSEGASGQSNQSLDDQVSSLALNNFLRALGSAAEVNEDDKEEGLEAAEVISTEHRQMVMAKIIKTHKYFLLKITNRIFNWDGLVENGYFDPEVANEFLDIIDDLDEDDFDQDEKEMMKDISFRLVNKEPHFVNRFVEILLQEIFRHMNRSGSDWVRMGRGNLTFEMMFLFMAAFRQFQNTGGIHNVVRETMDEFPWLIDLARKYGKRYPEVIRNLVRQGTISIPSYEGSEASARETESLVGSMAGASIEGSMRSLVRSMAASQSLVGSTQSSVRESQASEGTVGSATSVSSAVKGILAPSTVGEDSNTLVGSAASASISWPSFLNVSTTGDREPVSSTSGVGVLSESGRSGLSSTRRLSEPAPKVTRTKGARRLSEPVSNASRMNTTSSVSAV